MRLAILMSIASPWAREAAIRLSKLGHCVHIVDFAIQRGAGRYQNVYDDFQVSSISSLRKSVAGLHLLQTPFSSGLRYLSSALALRRIIERSGVEALLTLYAGGFATMAYLSGFRPYSVYVVGSDVLMADTIKKGMAKVSLSAASNVFVNGFYLAHKTEKIAPRAHLVPLYLGVDTLKFVPGSPPSSPVNIICTRGFVPVYNNEYVVRALALMSTEVPDFKVTFVSPGPTLDRVRSMADELLTPSVRKKVEFLGGVRSEALLENLKSGHVYISVSHSDGTSSSLLEALACGLFPVVSDIPQNREWVNSGINNGIVVPFEQPHVLAAALTRAITDHSLRAQAAQHNRQMVLERADSYRNMAVLSSILEFRSNAAALRSVCETTKSHAN